MTTPQHRCGHCGQLWVGAHTCRSAPVSPRFDGIVEADVLTLETAAVDYRRALAALRKIRDTERRPDLGPADVLRIVGETVEAFFAQVPK